jgi:hypothetical protein
MDVQFLVKSLPFFFLLNPEWEEVEDIKAIFLLDFLRSKDNNGRLFDCCCHSIMKFCLLCQLK